MDDLTFANLWYPDFTGIAFGSTNGKDLLICPYFDSKGNARYVYEKISAWNHNFIKIRFIEYGIDEYAFIAYQDPQGSFDKFNFGLYRSTMSRQPNYIKFKPQIQNELPKLAIVFSKTPSDISTLEPLGEPISIADCKILSESDLENAKMNLDDYWLEKEAHRLCHARSEL